MRYLAVPVLLLLAVSVNAQRPRVIDTSDDKPVTKPAPAPSSVKAKYEGGVFGYNKTMEGTLHFDDTNSRLLFKNKKQQEVLFIPYAAVTSAFADTQKRQPAAATVASHVPYIGLPASFIKTKVRYLTLQFNDPDTRMNGITSFRLENKDILESVLAALASKADLTARGQIFIKKRDNP